MTSEDMARNPTTTVNQLITISQEHLELSDDQLATALGYESGNVLACIKKGLMRFPIGKVPELARALDLDPGQLMRMALKEMDPSILSAVEACMGPLQLTSGEARLITALREESKGRGIAPIMYKAESLVAVLVAGEAQ